MNSLSSPPRSERRDGRYIAKSPETFDFSDQPSLERGYRVLFTTASSMIAALSRAEGRLDERLKIHTVPRLLIVDEIGYLPIDRTGANLFVPLKSRCYEHGSMILTTTGASAAGRGLWRPRPRHDPRSYSVSRDHR